MGRGFSLSSVRVHEIFYSLQGETSRTGLPTVFVRLTGCPLRCGYCDTAYAFHGGSMMAVDSILEQVRAFSTRYVTVTGGEPLAQKGCIELLKQLCDAHFSVSLETGGAMDIQPVDRRVSCILDIKTPGSGEVEKNRWENLAVLRRCDEIKFVLCDEADYLWARDVLHAKGLAHIAPVLFSPVYETLPALQLAQWILRDHLDVRLQIQLHKVLWGDVPGH
ncbi:MAG: 7-carboxy-7-deazaguanine synthase QueE [Proteobacteria bacterium]|nr:7-carboxy-7-deazaguanine synthase QueE [Pseudomonadota bacterium]MDE3207579.1 7-carboxy-7-deazaguanine synthase QueE [Pseudomonadota bacterium]